MTPGTKLGPYEILSSLGAGGMGEVYRARDTRLDRIVAIKILPDRFSDRPELRERFEREARTIASLNHPHICTLYDIGHQDGTDYLVMECLEGETLADRLAKGPLPLDQVLRFAIEISDALDKAHRKGVTHRDLKPGNIMLTKSGAKLLDFGLAKLRQEASPASPLSQLPTADQPITAQGMIVGTLQYMAPEQLEGKEVDARTDIFAFGAVVYEMATGKKAFEGKSQASVIAKILETDPPPISSLQPMTPPALDRLVKKCLAKDPDDRWQSASDLHDELKWIAGSGLQAAVSPGTVARSARTNWRQVALWSGIALLVGAAVASFAIWNLKPESRSAPADPVRFQVALPEMRATTLGDYGLFALSPDGRQLAFAAVSADGVSRIWIRPLDSLESRPLPGTEGITLDTFFWSSDSRYIVFRSSGVAGVAGGGGKLKKIAVSGGPAESLWDLTPALEGGSSNGDGVIIFGQDPGGVMRVSAGGGPPARLTGAASPTEIDEYPQFLRDGRRFIFTRISTRISLAAGVGDVFLGSLDGKPEEQSAKRLLTGVSMAAFALSSDGGPGYLLFVRDRALMAQPFDAGRAELSGEPLSLAERTAYFSASNNGVLAYTSASANLGLYQLTWFDRQGKVQSTVRAPSSEANVTLSPDGKRAFVTENVVQSNGLWLVDFSRGTKARFTFGSSPAGETGADAIWSLDGNRVVFVSSRDGAFTSIYEKPVSGAGDELLLLSSADAKHPRSWSRDGRYLFYDDFDSKTGRSSVRVLPLEGDKKPLPLQPPDFDEGSGQISPDGRWLAYASDETGRPEVYIRTFSPGSAGSRSVGGGKWLISSGGGTDPRWRDDGKEIFYLTSDGKVMAVELSAGPALQAGTPKVLFQGPPLIFPFGVSMPSQWGVTADGKRFLFEVPAASGALTQFTVVLNWPSLLKK